MNFSVNKSAPFSWRHFLAGNIFWRQNERSTSDCAVAGSFPRCCVSVCIGNLFSFKLVFVRRCAGLISNCKMYVSHRRVARVEIHHLFLHETLCTCHRLPRGGGPRADMGTLLIVCFKVLVFPHPCGICFLQSPQYLANPTGFEDALQNFIWVL